jgi:hypothetical protein
MNLNCDMRILLAIPLLVLLAPPLDACSCAGPGTPCQAVGNAAAVFKGKVLNVTFIPAVISPPVSANGRTAVNRSDGAAPKNRFLRASRVVRMQVSEPLSGLTQGQKEIEIVTGLGAGDCGYPFEPGGEYIVYAHKNGEGQLETSICSRTRPLARADEDLRYFMGTTGLHTGGELRIRTSFPGVPGISKGGIVAEGGGLRHRAITNAAGEAVFTGLPAGEYTLHAESDGDLPEDPKIQLQGKGCKDVTLFRILRITGRVLAKNGLPANRVEVQLRSTDQKNANDGRMTDRDGRYELHITRPGQYRVGINLNHTPTRDTPYPRWFYPGSEYEAGAEIINFTGKPNVLTYDFALPDPQSERMIEGIVLMPDGKVLPRARVTVFDSQDASIAQTIADADGRFLLRVFSEIAYRIHAVWPGDRPGASVSAMPIDIEPDSNPLSLKLILAQQGNSVLDGGKRGPKEDDQVRPR